MPLTGEIVATTRGDERHRRSLRQLEGRREGGRRGFGGEKRWRLAGRRRMTLDRMVEGEKSHDVELSGSC